MAAALTLHGSSRVSQIPPTSHLYTPKRLAFHIHCEWFTLFRYRHIDLMFLCSTDDGFYEIARYRFVSNGSEPTCITGVIGWVHGTYDLLANGSIVMTPFGDGYQQIQDPCAAVSNFVEVYNDTELYQSWRIFQDPVTGYKLHLFQFDGSPVAPQFQVSVTPNMLPTQLLRNVTTTTTLAKRGELVARNRGERRWSVGGAMGVVTAVFGTGVMTLLL